MPQPDNFNPAHPPTDSTSILECGLNQQARSSSLAKHNKFIRFDIVVEAEHSDAEQYDRWSLTLAGGTFLLSVAFLSDIVAGDAISCPVLRFFRPVPNGINISVTAV